MIDFFGSFWLTKAIILFSRYREHPVRLRGGQRHHLATELERIQPGIVGGVWLVRRSPVRIEILLLLCSWCETDCGGDWLVSCCWPPQRPKGALRTSAERSTKWAMAHHPRVQATPHHIFTSMGQNVGACVSGDHLLSPLVWLDRAYQVVSKGKNPSLGPPPPPH